MPAGEAVTELVGLLLRGPQDGSLQTAIPPDAASPSQTEAGDGVVIEMNDSFWSGSPSEIRRRVAQVVYTMAALEEGKQVTLLDGLVPGDVRGRDGTPLRQPLSREELEDLRPWIQVIQPVAGAIVGESIPVRVLSRGSSKVLVHISADGERLLAPTRVPPAGTVVGPLRYAEAGPLMVQIAARARGRDRRVSVPVFVVP